METFLVSGDKFLVKSTETVVDGTVEIKNVLTVNSLQMAATAGGLLLAAGGQSAGQAPLKFQSGPLLGTPELGALEYNGDAYNSYLYVTTLDNSTTQRKIVLSGGISSSNPIAGGTAPNLYDYYGINDQFLLAVPTIWIDIWFNGMNYLIPAYEKA